MPGFRFSDTATFDTNLESFLTDINSVDPIMADILRANKDKLAAIVRQGDRNAQARADFNAAIVEALDSLPPPSPGEAES